MGGSLKPVNENANGAAQATSNEGGVTQGPSHRGILRPRDSRPDCRLPPSHFGFYAYIKMEPPTTSSIMHYLYRLRGKQVLIFAITIPHNLVGLNHRNLLTVLEAGKSDVRAPARLGSGWNPLPSYTLLASCCVLTWQKRAS